MPSVQRRRVTSWLVRLAALLSLAGPVAAAQRDEDLFIRPEDQHTTFFGSLDAGRSAFVSGGAKQTLTGPLDRPGLVLMETYGFGLTRERARTGAGSVAVDRFVHDSSIMLGHQWISGPVYVAAFLGPELHTEQVTYDGRLRRVARPVAGLHGQIDIWANPTPDTLLTGTLIAGTSQMSLWVRNSAGWRIAPGLFVGPEVTAYVTPTYNEARFGAHLTGLSIGLLQFRLSAGWQQDDAHRQGAPYAGISAWMRL